MRVLIVTQRVDSDHDILGFFIGWLEHLSREADIDVIAQWVEDNPFGSSLPVRSLGKERGRSKLGRAWRLQRMLAARLLARREIDVILCHMCPEYVPMCFPIARLSSVPIALWYTHGTANSRLRLATRLADSVLTASDKSFPVPSSKVRVLGHGIDTDKFFSTPLPSSHPRREIVSVGRLSPVKDHETLIRAMNCLVHERRLDDIRLRIVGGPALPDQHEYLHRLQELVRTEGLEDHVELVGSVPYRQIEAFLQQSHLFVSASRTGSLDKAVLEGMASGRPIVTSNGAFDGELAGSESDLLFEPGDHRALADRIERLLDRDPEELEMLGRRLARQVETNHGLDRLVVKLTGTLEEVVRARQQ